MRPLDASAGAEQAASPLQCPAPAYGSSFSRAIEVHSVSGRRLLISGTASILPGGETAWVGDVRQQARLTFEVVEAILRERGFSFSDVTRATAYFKHRADARILSELPALPVFNSLPLVLAHCDVCRDELLFELEADAWKPSPHN